MPERVARAVARGSAALFVVGALYYLTLGGEYSLFHVRELRTERGAISVRIDSLQTELDALTAWADSLETDPTAIERVVREEYGFIRDGERLYRFMPPAEKAEADAAQSARDDT
jgi:cell division protein FtsB